MGREVLRDVSFDVPAGQVVGIAGPSAPEKARVAKLIQRLYVARKGASGRRRDLAMVDSAWLRRQLGVVLQDNVLFNRSIRDNIALAEPGAPMSA